MKSNLHRSHPVLYMQDGQTLFDPRTSYIPGRTPGRCASTPTPPSRTAMSSHSSSSASTTPATVAWPNTRPIPIGAWAAAKPTTTASSHPGTPPWIADCYRVRTDRDSTGLGGSSLGGLVSLYLGLRYATWFGKLAVLSPSVWWNRKSILGYVNERAPEIWDRPKLWLDVGDHEGRRTLQDVEHLNRRLKANHWRPGETLRFEKIHGGTHDEASWSHRVRPMLKFLFPANE